MIVRTWRGRVPLRHADRFAVHLRRTGIADYRSQPGCRDAALWKRVDGGTAIFTLVSVWDDLDAVRAYAGEEPERAVLYEGDETFDLVPDRIVRHHELVAPIS